MRSCLSTPPSAAKGPPAQPVLPRRDHARGLRHRPSAVMRPKLFHSISRELSSISRTCAPACQPLHPPQKGLQRGPYSPAAATRAAFASLPSALLRPKFLARSHTFSRIISRVTLLHLPCLSTPSTALKVLLTSIPFETGTLPANATTVSWPSRLPLRNTKYAIQRPTCSFPLARAWTTV